MTLRISFDSVGANLAAIMQNRVALSSVATGMGESLPSEGGALLDDDPTQTLWLRALDSSQLASLCDRQPIGNGNKVALTAIDETDRDAGRWGGAVGYWVDEASTVPSETKPKLSRLEMSLKKFLAVAGVTGEMAEDTAALDVHFPRIFGLEAAWQLDHAIINGTGAGQPLGILNSGALIKVTPESGQGTQTIRPENLIKMAARLWGPSHRNAVWTTSNDGFQSLATATFNTGSPVITYGEAGEKFILGMPLLLTEHNPTLGSVGDILLGDFSQYLIAEKTPDVLSSVHVRWLSDDRVLRFRYRTDGQSLWRSAITPKNATTTQSAFVALDSR
jgi:HK97 family phage major capsid protein